MYKRILIATDGSPLSDKAVEHGLSLAALTGASAVALKVVKRIESQWGDAAQAMVDGVKAQGEAQGVSVKPVIAKSDLVAEAIISAAKKHKCDVIVMASHGRKGLKRLLLGSETQHVLTHSSLPVLVLR
jgi:nucleotide-binding universal stress UspA family protein